jgi:cell division protein FtsL
MKLGVLLAWFVLIVAVVASAIGVVYARHQSRELFNELTRLERERDELEIEFGRLQLEQATWADTKRIEQVARADLGMVFPEPAQSRVIRR